LKRVAVFQKTASAPTQLANSVAQNTSDSKRSGKLAMVLKNKQRLVKQDEQYKTQVRQLQGELAETDQEGENLRSAALLLKTLNNRQSDVIMELRCRVKETFN
jgi:hypothetical protein